MSYQKPKYEVADVIKLCDVSGSRFHYDERKVINALQNCRTEAMGGHKDVCDSCGHVEPSYNSCRNRHCPKCGSQATNEWLQKRENELLPVGYFHIVFTIPHSLNKLFIANKRILYNEFFKCVKETIISCARTDKTLGVLAGFISVLHTWGQNLDYHPHVHCIVPGGGFKNNVWKNGKKDFFIHVKKLSKLFQGKMLSKIKQLYLKNKFQFLNGDERLKKKEEFDLYLKSLYEKDWVVYSKPPFAHPKTVLKYLSRYTHRVAISNHRIKKIENGKVFFTWKDYRTNKRKVMELDSKEFLRRFLMHLLPNRFVKIRFSGFMGNRKKKEYIKMCREQHGLKENDSSENENRFDKKNIEEWESRDVESKRVCRKCKEGIMIRIFLVPFYQKRKGNIRTPPE